MPSSRFATLGRCLIVTAVCTVEAGCTQGSAANPSDLSEDGCPAPVEASSPGEIWVTTNAACELRVDGESLGEISPYELHRFEIVSGEHEFTCSYERERSRGRPAVTETWRARERVRPFLYDVLNVWIGKAAPRGYYRNQGEDRRKRKRLLSAAERTLRQERERRAIETGVSTDLETRLMWTYRNNGEDIDWLEARDYCEASTAGGFSDWRLPTIVELWGAQPKSMWSETRLPLALNGEYEWSQSRKLPSRSDARARAIEYYYFTSSEKVFEIVEPRARVRCVRCGPPVPEPFTESEIAAAIEEHRKEQAREALRAAQEEDYRRLEAQAEVHGYVEDVMTGLTWTAEVFQPVQEKVTGFEDDGLTWFEAVDYCRELSIPGREGWRLPTTEELTMLVIECDEEVFTHPDNLRLPIKFHLRNRLAVWTSGFDKPKNGAFGAQAFDLLSQCRSPDRHLGRVYGEIWHETTLDRSVPRKGVLCVTP